jgi:hypothetical protein
MLANSGSRSVPGTRCGAMMDASKLGTGSCARHLLWGGRMLANWRSGSVPSPAAGQMDASKQGAGSGARHPLRGGWMLANWVLDRCQAPAVGGWMLANRGLDRCQAPVAPRQTGVATCRQTVEALLAPHRGSGSVPGSRCGGMLFRHDFRCDASPDSSLHIAM